MLITQVEHHLYRWFFFTLAATLQGFNQIGCIAYIILQLHLQSHQVAYSKELQY